VINEKWEVQTDPGSGREYYVNRQTGESQWDPPEELLEDTDAWEEKLDPASGNK
jgi:hypothetical protein